MVSDLNFVSVFLGVLFMKTTSDLIFILLLLSFISSGGILIMTSVPIDEISLDEMLILEKIKT